jgi:Ca2+-binding EF-hand superfamily protein
MKVSKLSFLVVGFVLSGSFLCASDVGPISFGSYDKNGDGYITQEEFDLRKNERMQSRAGENRQLRNVADSPQFSYFDINNDGKINKNELTIRQQERMQKRINEKTMYKQKGGNGPKSN